MSEAKDATSVDVEESETDDKPLFQKWKVVALLLGGFGVSIGSIRMRGVSGEALGSALGFFVGIILVMAIGTKLYRSVDTLQLGLIPPRAYAGIVLLAALVSAMAGGVATGLVVWSFVTIYVLLCGPALVIFAFVDLVN